VFTCIDYHTVQNNKDNKNGNAKHSTVSEEDVTAGVMPMIRSVTARKQDDDDDTSSTTRIDRGSVGSTTRLNRDVDQLPTISTFVLPSSGLTMKSGRSSVSTLNDRDLTDEDDGDDGDDGASGNRSTAALVVRQSRADDKHVTSGHVTEVVTPLNNSGYDSDGGMSPMNGKITSNNRGKDKDDVSYIDFKF